MRLPAASGWDAAPEGRPNEIPPPRLEAIRGRNVIVPPNTPSPGVLVAFIEDGGAPIELLQVDRSVAEDGI